jgi:hypothetical protein
MEMYLEILMYLHEYKQVHIYISIHVYKYIYIHIRRSNSITYSYINTFQSPSTLSPSLKPPPLTSSLLGDTTLDTGTSFFTSF